jgi:hypothetical protein
MEKAASALRPGNDTLHRNCEIRHAHLGGTAAGRDDCSLIHQVRQFGAAEARGEGRLEFQTGEELG